MSSAPTPAPAPTRAPIDPTEYGMVANALIRADRAHPDPDLDRLVEAGRAGSWQPLSAWFAALDGQWEVRGHMFMELNNALDSDDAWLLAWLREAPDDPAAWTFHCYWLIDLAWRIRTAKAADKVSRDQWRAFFRVLNQVPAAANRVRELSPGDPSGLVVHVGVAHGLQIPHDEYRRLWAELDAMAPNLVGARLSSVTYWLPKWSGSRELMVGYVEDTLARAEPGSLLTLLRLRALRELGSGDPDVPLADFIRTAEVQAAIDAALLDFAAADPAHPYYSRMSHWLSYYLRWSERHEEAVEHFRRVSGHCGSQPWRLFKDPKAQFIKHRDDSLRAVAGGR